MGPDNSELRKGAALERRRAAQAGVDFYNHLEARWMLERTLNVLAQSAKARYSGRHLGHLARTRRLDSHLYARHLRQPGLEGSRASRWLTEWADHELPDGSIGNLRLVSGLDTMPGPANKIARFALHALNTDGTILSLGVVTNRFSTRGLALPRTDIDHVGQTVEPSTFSWDYGRLDHFCDGKNPGNLSEPIKTATQPHSQQATYLLATTKVLLTQLEQ